MQPLPGWKQQQPWRQQRSWAPPRGLQVRRWRFCPFQLLAIYHLWIYPGGLASPLWHQRRHFQWRLHRSHWQARPPLEQVQVQVQVQVRLPEQLLALQQRELRRVRRPRASQSASLQMWLLAQRQERLRGSRRGLAQAHLPQEPLARVLQQLVRQRQRVQERMQVRVRQLQALALAQAPWARQQQEVLAEVAASLWAQRPTHW